MSPTIAIILLWIGFGATHMLLSSRRLRPHMVARFGSTGFLGVYSLVSFAFFVPLVWFYFRNKHGGAVLWSIGLSEPGRWAIYLGMGVALTISVAGILQPSPASLGAGKPVARGVLRITRHPLFMGFGILGLLHLIPNGFATDVAFFAGLPAFAIVGCRHQDQRKLADGLPGYREFCARAPFLPFTGKDTAKGIREMFPVAIGAGAAVTILIRYFHATLFG